MVRLLTSLIPAALLLPSAVAIAKTSHEGWPKINGDLIMNSSGANREIRATKLRKHNELLGGHGNDTLRAGRIGDVLWGDYKPGGQPESQVDRIYGGAGKDFIYVSHGTNFIHGGGGPDQIHAHFGHGAIWCASGKATVFVSRKSRKRYQLHGCTKLSYKTVGH